MIDKKQLKSFVDRIENLEAEKADLMMDIKDVYNEVITAGFDTKILKKIIKERKLNPSEIEEDANLLAVYRHALGMTPIEAAIENSVVTSDEKFKKEIANI